MARTDAGGVLTAEHRRAQLNLRAIALRDYMRIWPLWEGDEATFSRLVAAAMALVGAHHRTSAAVAVAYYEAFRAAERVAGPATPRLATLEPEAVAASLHVTGRVMTRRALDAGHSPQAAMRVALVRTAGAVTRHVLAGGRDTLAQSVEADRHARGYHRITSAGACSFCRSLAAQPYSGAFRAHDHCGCGAEPNFT